MKYLRRFSESRVVGFKYQEPTIKYRLSFSVLDGKDATQAITQILDDIAVQHEDVVRSARTNTYKVYINVYNDREVDTIINDLSLKMMMDNYKIDDVTKYKL